MRVARLHLPVLKGNYYPVTPLIITKWNYRVQSPGHVRAIFQNSLSCYRRSLPCRCLRISIIFLVPVENLGRGRGDGGFAENRAREIIRENFICQYFSQVPRVSVDKASPYATVRMRLNALNLGQGSGSWLGRLPKRDWGKRQSSWRPRNPVRR